MILKSNASRRYKILKILETGAVFPPGNFNRFPNALRDRNEKFYFCQGPLTAPALGNFYAGDNGRIVWKLFYPPPPSLSRRGGKPECWNSELKEEKVSDAAGCQSELSDFANPLPGYN